MRHALISKPIYLLILSRLRSSFGAFRSRGTVPRETGGFGATSEYFGAREGSGLAARQRRRIGAPPETGPIGRERAAERHAGPLHRGNVATEKRRCHI